MTPSINIPQVVAISREELDELKSMLKEILATLKERDETNFQNQWIESTEARKMLGVSAKTWQDYRDTRVIPFSQFGRKIYVKRADIEAFLMNHQVKARSSKRNGRIDWSKVYNQ